MAEFNRGTKVSQVIRELKIGPVTVGRVTETKTIFDQLPKPARTFLRKSSVPPEYYTDAAELVSVAYHRVRDAWTSEVVGDTPDLSIILPGPLDLDETIEKLRGKVAIDDLVELSSRMFARSNTAGELLIAMKNELDLIFNPPENIR